MSKQIKTHKCPTCGKVNECDVVLVDADTHHNCKDCGSTWRESDHVVMSGGGEPK